MNYDQLDAIVSRITYKPGYRISARFSHGDDQIVLHLATRLPNSDGSGDTIPIVCTSYVYSGILTLTRGLPANVIINQVKEMIRDHELHEMNEWLKVDGVHYRQPHPELKPA